MRTSKTETEKVRDRMSKAWDVVSIRCPMRCVGTSEEGGRRGEVGLSSRGHERDNENSMTLSLLDKGTTLKTGDIVDVLKPAESISLQDDSGKQTSLGEERQEERTLNNSYSDEG